MLSVSQKHDCPDDLELEKQVSETANKLPVGDPLKRQLIKLYETIHQMRKRVFIINDLPKFTIGGPKNFPVEGIEHVEGKVSIHRNDTALIASYESRIRNLERLLQEKYLAAHNLDTLMPSGKVKKLSEGTINVIEKQTIHPEFRNLVDNTFKEHDVDNPPDSLPAMISQMFSELKLRDAALQNLTKESASKIAFKDFQVGSLILLLPTVRKGIWSLFNLDCPNYYVHPDSVRNLMTLTNDSDNSDWYLARIQSIVPKKSTGKKSNPYRLPNDFEYFEVVAGFYDPSEA